jgi:N6-L-threonylcarbamoyladenine synthase
MASPATPELVLGIESSCDETAAALVRAGREVLSSVVHSQAPEHALHGGVVPEIAGRSHLRHIVPVIDEALEQAGVELDDVDALAVTARPGLIGSLLVGLSTAKALAYARGLSFVCVDHIQAHAYAATMEADVRYPCLALVVSGGHTALYRMESAARMAPLAATRDDAAGEAFDKVAQMLGLGYPGGPGVSRLAARGNRHAFDFPRYRPRDGRPGFSFSGVKTAVLYHLRGQDALAPTPAPEDVQAPQDVAASFQEAVVDMLVEQTLRTAQAERLRTVLVTGGVACNPRLRERMSAEGAALGIRVVIPSPRFCSDNAAMVAGLGFRLLEAGERAALDADASPR